MLDTYICSAFRAQIYPAKFHINGTVMSLIYHCSVFIDSERENANLEHRVELKKVWVEICSRNKCSYNLSFLKKRWHIYCNINVIYIVFSCWKRQKIQFSVAAEVSFFLFWCALTIHFFWHMNKSFIIQQQRLKNKMVTALLGIRSSYEAFWNTKLRATVQLCSWNAICK